MACKLVAIYQKHIQEFDSNNIHEVLPPSKIDEYIGQPLNFGAQFDLDKMDEKQPMKESEFESLDAMQEPEKSPVEEIKKEEEHLDQIDDYPMDSEILNQNFGTLL